MSQAPFVRTRQGDSLLRFLLEDIESAGVVREAMFRQPRQLSVAASRLSEFLRIPRLLHPNRLRSHQACG
jgi:hypothetical protein